MTIFGILSTQNVTELASLAILSATFSVIFNHWCCFCSVILWAWITQNPFACHAFISFQVSISPKQWIHSKKNGQFLGHGNIGYGLNRILWFFPTVHFEKTIQVRNCLLTCFSNRSINSHVNCDDEDLKNTKSIILPHFFSKKFNFDKKSWNHSFEFLCQNMMLIAFRNFNFQNIWIFAKKIMILDKSKKKMILEKSKKIMILEKSKKSWF